MATGEVGLPDWPRSQQHIFLYRLITEKKRDIKRKTSLVIVKLVS